MIRVDLNATKRACGMIICAHVLGDHSVNNCVEYLYVCGCEVVGVIYWLEYGQN